MRLPILLCFFIATSFTQLFVVSSLAAAASQSKRVVLYNSGTCPYAQRAWIALVEKGIDFDFEKVDLQNKSPEFLEAYRKANPNPLCSAKVPVLAVERDGEDTQIFTESNVVLEAIEEIWPEPPLLPSNVDARARARVFGSVVYDAAFGGTRSAYQAAKRKLDSEMGGETWDEQSERISLCESLSALNTSLFEMNNVGPFVLGDCFGLAECMAAPFVLRANAVWKGVCGLDVVAIAKQEGYTRVAAWWEAILERESVVSTGVSVEEAIDGAKRVAEMIRAREKK